MCAFWEKEMRWHVEDIKEWKAETKNRFEIRDEPTSGQEFEEWAQSIVGLMEDRGKFISSGAHGFFYYSSATNCFWSIPRASVCLPSLFRYYSQNAPKLFLFTARLNN